MSIKGIFYITAFASDLEKSKIFYRETLGWKLNTDLPKVSGFFFGSGYLVLQADTRDATSRLYAGGMHVEVQVEDVVIEHERLKKLDVNVSDLMEEPWGERKFTFSDPDGYLWAYGQPS